MKKLITIFGLALLLSVTSGFGPSTAGKFGTNHTVTGGCTTYATFDPVNKNAGCTLTNGNLTIDCGASQGAITTIGVSSGKHYWELVCTGSGASTAIGIADSSYTFGVLGGASHSWGYYGSTGNKEHNGSSAGYGASYTTETIGVALDMDGGTITMYKSNVAQNSGTPMYTGLTGTIYGAVTPSSTPLCTANFGATALTYSPPAGYTAGLCN